MNPIFDNIALHNVAETSSALTGGTILHRFPKEIRDNTESPIGRLASRNSNGVELRFVIEVPRVVVYVSSEDCRSDLYIMRGNYLDRIETVEPNTIHKIWIENKALEKNRSQALHEGSSFSIDVWRIYSTANPFIFHGIDPIGNAVRPPHPDELPQKKWIAYGSSITQGGESMYNYVNMTAAMLGMDVKNLGMGGSCFAEPMIAEFIASDDTWDLLTMELGINMAGMIDLDTFNEKVETFLNILSKSVKDHQKLVLITPFLSGLNFEIEESIWGKHIKGYEQILYETHQNYSDKLPLHIINGKDLISNFLGFKFDMLHPTPFGHGQMAHNLTTELRKIL